MKVLQEAEPFQRFPDMLQIVPEVIRKFLMWTRTRSSGQGLEESSRNCTPGTSLALSALVQDDEEDGSDGDEG